MVSGPALSVCRTQAIRRSRVRRHTTRPGVILLAILALLCAGERLAFASPQATATTLAITSAGSPVSTVASQTTVTLTATVAAGTAPVTPGVVNFCDASASYCTDIHLLGTAQLTSAGTATFKFRPGIGAHTYKAIFAGTTTYATSTSSAVPLSVTGLHPTTTAIASSGSVGAYTLTATVIGTGSFSASPSGSVSFLDTTSGGSSLGAAPLGPATSGLSFLNSANLTIPAVSVNSVVVGDFNGDGIPDIAATNQASNFQS